MKPKKVNKTSVVDSSFTKLTNTSKPTDQFKKEMKCSATNRTNSKSNNQTNAGSKQSFFCSECEKPIVKDKFLLRACDKYWHENCLKCDRCHGRLGELGSTLYWKSNMKLCRHDYLDLFGKTGVCSVCDKLILATEMAMKAKENVYHLECFACQLCNQRFCVGDRFYLCENKVVCQYDYDEHILPIQSSLFHHNHQQQCTQPSISYDREVSPSAGDLDNLLDLNGQSECNQKEPEKNSDEGSKRKVEEPVEEKDSLTLEARETASFLELQKVEDSATLAAS